MGHDRVGGCVGYVGCLAGRHGVPLREGMHLGRGLVDEVGVVFVSGPSVCIAETVIFVGSVRTAQRIALGAVRVLGFLSLTALGAMYFFEISWPNDAGCNVLSDQVYLLAFKTRDIEHISS